MRSVQSTEEHYKSNYEIPYKDQKDAADAIRRKGAKVNQLDITIWLVNGQYISPATMIKRLEEGFYEPKKEESDGEGSQVVDVSRNKGKSTRPMGKESGRVLRDSDERRSGQERRRDYGRGGRVGVRTTDSRTKTVARAEASLVRKHRSSVSDEEDNYSSDEKAVERRRGSSSDSSKPRRAGKSDLARPKALRRTNTTRLRTKAGLRKRRS